MAADAGITGLLEKLGYQRIEQLGVIQDVTMKDELLLAIAEGELDEEEVKRIQKAHDAHLLEIYNGLAADFRRQFEKLITENELTEQAEFNIFLEIENLRELNYKKALQLIKRRIKNRRHAKGSRKKKDDYAKELFRDKTDLKGENAYLKGENAYLKQQLALMKTEMRKYESERQELSRLKKRSAEYERLIIEFATNAAYCKKALAEWNHSFDAARNRNEALTMGLNGYPIPPERNPISQRTPLPLNLNPVPGPSGAAFVITPVPMEPDPGPIDMSFKSPTSYS